MEGRHGSREKEQEVERLHLQSRLEAESKLEVESNFFPQPPPAMSFFLQRGPTTSPNGTANHREKHMYSCVPLFSAAQGSVTCPSVGSLPLTVPDVSDVFVSRYKMLAFPKTNEE